MTQTIELAGYRCLVLSESDPPLHSLRDATDYIGEAMGDGVQVLVVPADFVDAAFFRLRSGVAGEILQKVVQYRIRFAMVGDIAEHVTKSDALRDFVIECNRGREIAFQPNMAALEEHLAAVETHRLMH